MKVRQYVYLGMLSETVDPGQISHRLGLVPDEIRLRGSRHPGPPSVPRTHIWQLNSGVVRDDVPLNDHFEALLARLAGSASRVRALLDEGAVDGVIRVVRRFDPGPEDVEIVKPGRQVGNLEKVGGQHPLVGFGIDAELLKYAAEANLVFDFDEYADEDQ